MAGVVVGGEGEELSELYKDSFSISSNTDVSRFKLENTFSMLEILLLFKSSGSSKSPIILSTLFHKFSTYGHFGKFTSFCFVFPTGKLGLALTFFSMFTIDDLGATSSSQRKSSFFLIIVKGGFSTTISVLNRLVAFTGANFSLQFNFSAGVLVIG